MDINGLVELIGYFGRNYGLRVESLELWVKSYFCLRLILFTVIFVYGYCSLELWVKSLELFLFTVNFVYG
jgi:hypothetical protein